MQTLKILVTGAARSGRTAFIRSLSEIDVLESWKDMSYTTPHGENITRTISLDFGRTTLSESLALYYLGTVRNQDVRDAGSLLDVFHQNHVFKTTSGLVMMICSQWSVDDAETWYILDKVQSLNCPYLIALSCQDLPDARLPQKIRDVFKIPDDIKILGYNWKDPKTTKQIVLELLSLRSQDDLVKQVIEGLKVQIQAP